MPQPLSTSDFIFACPSCAQQILVDESSRGGWAECPVCGGIVRVPAGDEGREDPCAQGNENGALREQLASALAERDALAAQLRESAARAEAARMERSELELHVSLLQVQFAESVIHRKALETVQQQLQAAREQRKALHTQLDEREAAVAEAGKAADALREETKALQVRVEHLSNQLNGRDRELKEARQRLAAFSLHAVGGGVPVEEASRRLAVLEIEGEAREAKLREAAQAERTYRSIIEQTQAAHSAAQRNLETIRAERDGLRTSVEHLEAQLEANFEHLRVIESERAAIHAGLERAKQHVTVLQTRRDQMREEIACLRQALGFSVETSS